MHLVDGCTGLEGVTKIKYTVSFRNLDFFQDILLSKLFLLLSHIENIHDILTV